MAPAVSTQREGERFGQPVESEEERQEDGLPFNNSGKDLNAFFHQPFWRQNSRQIQPGRHMDSHVG